MSLDAYPRIGDWITVRNGRLKVRTGKVDIGQRISTALSQIAHEELGVPYDQIDIAHVRTGDAPDEGMTSGSNSIEQSGRAVQAAASTIRALLSQMLAAKYGGAPEDWVLEEGDLHLPDSNHRFPVLELLKEVDGDQPVDTNVRPIARSGGFLPRPEMRGIGKLVKGRYTFIHDLDLPGMWHARVVRPPHANARLGDVPESARQRLVDKGLHLVRDGSFLAIAGPEEWPVVDQAQKLAAACDWDLRDGLPEMDIFAHLNGAKATRLHAPDAAPEEGPIPEPITTPNHTARYERPYQLHGALAPSAAMAVWSEGVLTLKSHSQGILEFAY